MRIDQVLGSHAASFLPSTAPAADAKGASFADALDKSLSQVNELQTQADNLASRVAAGDIGSTQQAMVALEKASLALDLTVQVRNKALDAYQELMRTQT
jgi:flagellar hook-basal body complex protein FliE